MSEVSAITIGIQTKAYFFFLSVQILFKSFKVYNHKVTFVFPELYYQKQSHISYQRTLRT